MQCPRCGYALTPFDDKCPKCAHRPQAGAAANPAPRAPAALPEGLPDPLQIRQVAAQPAPRPAAGPAAPAASLATPAGGSRSSRRALWIALLLLLAIPLAGGLLVVAAKRSAGGLRLVESSRGTGGRSVVQAPAVSDAQIGRRLLGAGATTGGEVEVSLAWNTLSDFDLELRAPSGEMVWARNHHAQCGGVQDVDANPTLVTEEGARRSAAGQNPGPENVLPVPEILVDLEKNLGLPEGFRDLMTAQSGGTKAPSLFTRSPVEHIHFAQAPKGAYTVYASCYSWREKDSQPEPFTIQVRSRGRVFYQVSGTLGPQSYITHNIGPSAMCQFEVR